MENPLYLALIEFPIMIIGGGLEEIGWRGYLQAYVAEKMVAIQKYAHCGWYLDNMASAIMVRGWFKSNEYELSLVHAKCLGIIFSFDGHLFNH